MLSLADLELLPEGKIFHGSGGAKRVLSFMFHV